MPCIFCIAVLTMVAAAVTAAALDQMQGALQEKSGAPVRKTADTDSVAKLETTFQIGGKVAPIAVTVYKTNGRARIQVLTHELTAAEVQELQDRIALAIGGRIVDRTDLSGSSLLREDPPAQGTEEPLRARSPLKSPGTPPPREQ